MTDRNEVLEFLDEMESSDEEIRREAQKERIRLALALAMVRARKARGLSQSQVAERLGVSQSWVSKLENPDIAHTFESIIDYLQAIDAELEIAIHAGSRDFTVSRAEPATTAPAATQGLGSTFLESSWEGPTGGPSRTLELSLSSKAGFRDMETGRPKPRSHRRYPSVSAEEVVVSETPTSTYGGSYDHVN